MSVLTSTDFRRTFWPSEGQKHSKGGVNRAPSQRKVFQTFFLHVLRYELKTWYIHPAGGTTHEVWVSSQSSLCLWRVFQNFFLHVLRYELATWCIHPAGGTTHEVWVSLQSGLCLWRVFQTFFYVFWGINLKVGLYTQYVAQHIEFMFHQNGIPVTFIKVLSLGTVN